MPEKKREEDPFKDIVIEQLKVPDVTEEEIYLLKFPDGTFLIRHKDELEKMKKEGRII